MNVVSVYLQKIEKDLMAGNATEHTYRPALKALVESFDEDINATNEPKRERCGAPDFVVAKSTVPIGYIEAKDVGKSLDLIERDEQLKRYRGGLHNLILTDYLEFRWYVKGKHRLTVRLAHIGEKGRLKAVKDGANQLMELIQAFLHTRTALINSPRELAVRMAALASFIRDAIPRALADEEGGGSLHEQMEGFRKVLLHDLTVESFADMYAQTIAYGLFAARCNVKVEGPFVREHAAYELPKTNPFLRKMFSYIAGPDLEERLVWIANDLTALLDRTDMAAILRDFGKRTRREDPVVHFYETFLAAYDRKMREARGVYYTPEPVVSYIVRSIDYILKQDFKLRDGLADASRIKIKTAKEKGEKEIHKVLILDPATGTGTFLHQVIHHIYEHICMSGQKGAWGGSNGYVTLHLLPRVFGFELLMAPYTVAHMKLGLQLAEYGYDFSTNERLRVYLTNALEEVFSLKDLPPFAEWIAREANAAGEVKQDIPVMVVLGNPPYSGHSANKGKWIGNLLRGIEPLTGKKTDSYFEVDGNRLEERNPKWLNDDYVKFIRFAQWRIDRTGYGILAFITNHGYLDNPTFRGMRQSLMRSFDDIYVLDLHGNSKKRERCPDGSKDENIFDIQQGVAIGIFVKRGSGEAETATVRHADLWGLREVYEDTRDGKKLAGGKYHWLWDNDITTTKWQDVAPQSPSYLFVTQDVNLRAEYENGWKLKDIMPVNNTGLITSRDKFVFGFSKDEVLRRIHDFAHSSLDHAREFYELRDVRERSLQESQNIVCALPDVGKKIVKCLYRPFDERWLFYHHSLVRWPVYDVMGHMVSGANVGLITARSNKSQSPDHFFCSKLIMETKCGEATTQSCLFPLYLYSESIKDTLFDKRNVSSDRTPYDKEKDSSRCSNLALAFIEDFSARLKMIFIPDGKGDCIKTFGPEDVFDYMYAVFHSPTYRNRYAAFLKLDFPRLPLTSNTDLFRSLCNLGEELVALHLMEKQLSRITTYPIAGDNTVETVRYSEPDQGGDSGRVWINKTQYFEKVPPEVWNYHVGGYQVCQKWLKDRKGRQLTYDDITHYQYIVAALKETIRLMEEIDRVIDANGGWPLK
ncbi:MAG: DNA methyltransferase [Deltaproteobacteria bacterium]|nr:DNA methyltransferase [Deltaproteobacteria bacterium]